MNLSEILNSNATVNITVSLDDLRTYSKELIQNTKNELEEIVNAELSEVHQTPKYVSEYLGVCIETLWRWAKRGYLVPIQVGGRRLYKMSEVKAILNGGKKETHLKTRKNV